MNLQENIIRVKSIMGLLKEDESDKEVSFRRRLDILPKVIRATYKWLNPKAFDDFDSFLDRVIFSATRDFVWESGISDEEKFEKVREEIKDYVREFIMDNLVEEIKFYFIRERGLGD